MSTTSANLSKAENTNGTKLISDQRTASTMYASDRDYASTSSDESSQSDYDERDEAFVEEGMQPEMNSNYTVSLNVHENGDVPQTRLEMRQSFTDSYYSGSSESDSSDFSDDSEYDDLLDTLPISVAQRDSNPLHSGTLFGMNILSGKTNTAKITEQVQPVDRYGNPNLKNDSKDDININLSAHLDKTHEKTNIDPEMGSSIMISPEDLDESISSSYSDSSDSEESTPDYDALMNSMPTNLSATTSSSLQLQRDDRIPKPSATPMPVSEGLDLSMLMNLRSELEKVGQMIVEKKEGEKFLRRAHILASINMLAAYIPACVVDHLSQEIRDALAKKATEQEAVSVSLDSGTESSLLPSEQAENSRRFRTIRNIGKPYREYDDDDDEDDDDGSGRGPRLKLPSNLLNKSESFCSSGTGSLDKFLEKGVERRMSISYQEKRPIAVADEKLDALPAAAQFEGAVMFCDITGKDRGCCDGEGMHMDFGGYVLAGLAGDFICFFVALSFIEAFQFNFLRISVIFVRIQTNPKPDYRFYEAFYCPRSGKLVKSN